MGAWGAGALTGFRLHLGRGEPGWGDLLPASCRGGEGREDASEGLKAWPGHRQPCPWREGSGLGGLRLLVSASPADVIARDASSCVAILQVIIIAKLCQSCPGSGLLEEKGGRLGRGLGWGRGPFVFSTNCHSRFVGLPLRLLLKTLLMLRESGRSALGGPLCGPQPAVAGVTVPARSMPGKGLCCVRVMGPMANQSGHTRRPHSQAVRGRDTRPGWAELGPEGSWAGEATGGQQSRGKRSC